MFKWFFELAHRFIVVPYNNFIKDKERSRQIELIEIIVDDRDKNLARRAEAKQIRDESDLYHAASMLYFEKNDLTHKFMKRDSDVGYEEFDKLPEQEKEVYFKLVEDE